MAKNKQIAIILADRLQFYGLDCLLKEYFSPLQICYFPDMLSLVEKQPDLFDFYFTDAQTFLIYWDYFLPRRNKVIILVDKPDTNLPVTNMISTRSSIETTIELLESVLLAENTSSTTDTNNKDLSGREIDVLQQIVRGHTNKEIAEHLNISLNTVLSHRKNITAKLGIKTVSGLTFYAIMNGLISGDEIEL